MSVFVLVGLKIKLKCDRTEAKESETYAYRKINI